MSLFQRNSISKTITIPTIKQIIAHKIWLLSHVIDSYWFGSIFLPIHKSVSNVSFQGQILFNDHSINPVNDAKVNILKCLNNQERILENNTIQTIAPITNIHIVVISKFLIASIIVSYVHSKTSMKLPEIHGKIIAQIAIAPQIKIHRRVEVIESGVLVGAVIKKAIAKNTIRHKIVFQFRLTCFHKNIAEIKINPTKNDQINIG